MLERYFVFLYPEPEAIRELLDLAVYLLNPDEKWRAHVTVAGPYSNPNNLPRNRGFVEKISLIGAGQFRSETQNTVFIKVGSANLRNFWDKPDFSFTPHLTLYDGNNSSLADSLYTALVATRMWLKFYVSQVHVVRSVKGQGNMELLTALNPAALPALRNRSPQELRALPDAERLFFALETLKRAKLEASRL